MLASAQAEPKISSHTDLETLPDLDLAQDESILDPRLSTAMRSAAAHAPTPMPRAEVSSVYRPLTQGGFASISNPKRSVETIVRPQTTAAAVLGRSHRGLDALAGKHWHYGGQSILNGPSERAAADSNVLDSSTMALRRNRVHDRDAKK